MAKVAGLSRFHFLRMFKARFGMRPKAVETALRVELAKQLILAGLPMAEVASRCGFSNQSHFGARFKIATGQTPTQWRLGGLPAAVAELKQEGSSK